MRNALKIISVIFICMLSCAAYCESIKSHPLDIDYGSNNDARMDTKMDEFAREMQGLNNRIDVLEHTVNELKAYIQNSHSTSNSGAHESSSMNDKAHAKVHDANVQPESSTHNGTASDLERSVHDNNLPESANSDTKRSSEKQDYDIALATFKDGNMVESAKLFGDFIKSYPNSNLNGNAHFWYAETFFRRKMYDSSAINFLKSYKNAPKGAKAPDALLKLASSLHMLKQDKEACAMIAKLLSEFPQRNSAINKKASELKELCKCN
jgi:tol-pal system protein YbgF